MKKLFPVVLLSCVIGLSACGSFDSEPRLNMEPSDPTSFGESFNEMKSHINDPKQVEIIDKAFGIALYRVTMKVHVAAAEQQVSDGTRTSPDQLKQNLVQSIDDELTGLTADELVQYADQHMAEAGELGEKFRHYIAQGLINPSDTRAW